MTDTDQGAPQVEPKPAASSLTMQGLAVIVLGMLAQWLGVEMDQAALGQAVGQVWMVAGLVVAAIGRARASAPLIWRKRG
jgi:hypothetical protein